MLVKDLDFVEKEYYIDHHESVIPDLLCAYYEAGKFGLVYYYSLRYYDVFEQCRFYLMLSLMDLGYSDDALSMYSENIEEWFNLCKQWKIYWRHVAIFAILFRNLNISEYYDSLFNDYYFDDYVQLINLFLTEEKVCNVKKTPSYIKAITQHPQIEQTWKENNNNQIRIISFEDVQWKIWNKYNNNINNGNQYGIEKVFDSSEIRIFSYKPKETAASMHILSDGITNILLDCGCEIINGETKRIPVEKILSEYEIPNLDAVIITHAHMDHYGSLNEISHKELYMSDETNKLIRLSSPTTFLKGVHCVNPYDKINIDGVTIQFIPNGHICGSMLLDIDWKSTLRIVYTGDYSIEDQQTVKGLLIEDILNNKKRIDILITETTYGHKKHMLRLSDYENIFRELCYKQITYGNKIFIPCFAIGRAQEVAMSLSKIATEKDIRILIDGMAARVTDFYQSIIGFKILNDNIAITDSEEDYRSKLKDNDVILASSGMLREGTASAKYIEEILKSDKGSIIKVGYIRQDEPIFLSIINRQTQNINFDDVPLSAHASYWDLVETLEKLSPNTAIYVHGQGIDKQ